MSFDSPWKLEWNKFHHYPGGREIDRFRGIVPPLDDGPEAWIGSDTRLLSASPVTPMKDAPASFCLQGRENTSLSSLNGRPAKFWVPRIGR